MKRLIILALLSIMIVGCGTSTEDQQINTIQAYEYSNNLESYDSEIDTDNTVALYSSDINDNYTDSENQLSKIGLEPIDKTVFIYRLFIVSVILMIITTLLLNFIMHII